MPTERILKVLSKAFPRAFRKYVFFPEIRLAGKWLQDIGFVCGRSVAITCSKDSITITMLPEIKVEPAVKKEPKKHLLLPEEFQNIPGDQFFQHFAAEDFHAYLEKRKARKNKKAAPLGTARVVLLHDQQSVFELSNQPLQSEGHTETNHSA